MNFGDRHEADAQRQVELRLRQVTQAEQRPPAGRGRGFGNQQRRTVAAEYVRNLPALGDVEHGVDAGGADQVDVLVATLADRAGRALDIGNHDLPVVRRGGVMRGVGDAGKIVEGLEVAVKPVVAHRRAEPVPVERFTLMESAPPRR